MTLIEILIVVSLMALLAGALLFGSGMFGGAEQRAAASLVIAGVRKGLARANSTGLPVRMVFDFDARRIWMEESSSSLALRASPNAKDEMQGLVADAKAEGEEVSSGVTPHRPSFVPVDLLGQEGDTPGRSLGGQVQLRLVQTEHDEEPITAGKAQIMFWPGGMTERAVVQVGVGDNDGLTVVLSPLTGRARIERGRVPLPEPRFGDDEFSERDEP